ncbi:MAG: FecR family protein [Treponema sp.]|nr:FecR family protein [Treponema sp.]
MKKVFLTVCLMSAAVYGFAQNGVIRELTGDVTLRHAGSDSFVPAAAGNLVAQDTIVSTGFRSSAIIEIGSSTITVRPITRLSLGEIQAAAGTETLSVNLQAGRVRVDVRPPAGASANFTMQGPSATASVRGTSFEFDARSVRVLEGTVHFAGGRGAPVMVRAGGESVAAVGGRAADPVQIAFGNLSPPAPVGAGVSGEASAVSGLTPQAGTPPDAGDGGIDIEIDF